MLAHVCWCFHSIHIIAQTCIDMHRHYAEYTSVDKVYMVVDLKVLVKNYGCDAPSCCVLNPRQSLCSSSRKSNLFSESFAEVMILWVITLYTYITCGDIFAQIPRKLRERAAKAKVHFEGGGPGSLTNVTQYLPNKQQSLLRTDSVMLAACLLGYHEAIYTWSFGQWRKIDMEFAKVSRKLNLIARRMAVSRWTIFDQAPHDIYIYIIVI
jgi:hypothetical protein